MMASEIPAGPARRSVATTSCPCSRRSRTTAPPALPLAPVTQMAAMWSLLSTRCADVADWPTKYDAGRRRRSGRLVGLHELLRVFVRRSNTFGPVLGLVAQELHRDLMPADETGVLAEVGEILAFFLGHVIT